MGLDGWMDGVGDTPWTVMTTRAPAVLKTISGWDKSLGTVRQKFK